MSICPQCGTSYNIADASDRCSSCGSFLPHAGTVRPVWSEKTPATATPAGDLTVQFDGGSKSGASDEERPSSDLIRPQKLSAEFADHVTQHWARTDDQFRNHRETIHSHADTTEKEEGLLIGERKVVNVDDGELGDYEVADAIGEGGMGIVSSARQAALNRHVAIKYPKRKSGQTEQQQNKFIFEVVVTGRLDHPNIVPIYDLARDQNGRLFYAMKRVDGQPWDTCIHDGSLTFEQNLEILLKVCDAIRFAHDQDVIHCDIKPQNIMVGRYGEVSVMDFGAAVRLVNGVAVASAGGTFSYMAPEIAQDRRGHLCRATDVYLLGAVLYEIITGEPPHPPPVDSKSRAEMFLAAARIAATNEIRPISDGGELADIAHKALATEISDRYQNVSEFQDAIRSYLSHAESITLADRARQHFRNATDDSPGTRSAPGARFDEFDRARFAFEEALNLWPENEPAKKGLAEATIASARYALREGAYSRGIALLDANNPDHARLLGRLQSARRRTNRLYTLLRTAAAIIIVGGTTLSATLYYWYKTAQDETSKKEVQRERAIAAQVKAVAAQTEAETERDNVKLQEAETEKARKAEEKAKNEALDAKKIAENAKEDADKSADDARRQRDRAERSSYTSEIGVAEKALQRNAFTEVRDILQRQTANPNKNPLRDWEWSYLNYLANEQPCEKFELPNKQASQRYEAAAISDDGRLIAAGTVDGKVYLWRRDAKAATQAVEKLDFGVAVNSVAIAHADGKYLLAAVGDNKPVDQKYHLKLWQVLSDKAPTVVNVDIWHSAPILSVAFSKDAKRILTSSADGTAALWSREGGQPLSVLHVTEGRTRVWSAQFSPGEKWIVTAADDGKVCVWGRQSAADEKTYVKWEQFADHNCPVHAAQFVPTITPSKQDPDRLPLYVVSGDQLGRLMIGKFHRDEPGAWRKEQKAEIESQLARIASEPIPAKMDQLGKHAASIESIAFSPDGERIFTSSDDNTVAVWDASGGIEKTKPEPKILRGHGGWVHACAVVGRSAADANSRVLSAGYDGRVLLWDWQKYSAAHVLAEDSQEQLASHQLTSAAASLNGEWIATASQSGFITMWDMHDWSNPKPQILREGHDWQATTGVFFDQGNRLVTSGGDNTTIVWDAARGQELQRFGTWYGDGTGWRGIAAVSQDGGTIATGSNPSNGKANGTSPTLAKLWDRKTGKSRDISGEMIQVKSGEEPAEATSISFSPDGKTIAIGNQMGGCYLCDQTTAKRIMEFKAHDKTVIAARFLPDGKMLITASDDGYIKKWDVSINPPLPVFKVRHGDHVVAIDVSPDGQRFISAANIERNTGAAKTVMKADNIRLWNAATGAQESVLPAESVQSTLQASLNSTFGRVASSAARKETASGSDNKEMDVRSVAFHPTDSAALISVHDPNVQGDQCFFGRWNWTQREQPFELLGTPQRADISMAVYTPHDRDKFLAVGGRGARMLTLRPAPQGVTHPFVETAMTYRAQAGVNSISFSPDCQTLVCAGSDGSIKIWKLGQQRRWEASETLPARSPDPVTCVQFDPRDNQRFLSSGPGGIQLWQRENNAWSHKLIEKTQRKSVPVNQVVFADDSQFFVAATQERADIWQFVPNGAPQFVRSIPGAAQCLAISDSGQILAVGNGTQVSFYDIRTGKSSQENTKIEHSAEITSLCFSANGKRLFTASKDFTVKVWDVSAKSKPTEPGNASLESNNELMTLTEHQGTVTSVQFVPLRDALLTTSLDGQAILWPFKMQ